MDSDSTRRDVLKLGAAGIATAGFSIPVAGTENSDHPVRATWVQDSIISEGVHYNVTNPEGKQYLFATIPESQAYEDYTLMVDGTKYTADNQISSVNLKAVNPGLSLDHEKLLGFEIPYISANSARLQHSGTNTVTEFGPEVVRLLDASSTFAIRDISIPDEGSQYEEFEASVTVANVGERDGTFRATFTSDLLSGSATYIELDVSKGDEVTWTGTRSPKSASGQETFRLDWGADSLTADLQVK